MSSKAEEKILEDEKEWSAPISHKIAPIPNRLSDIGLSEHFITELLAKHLYQAGVLLLSDIVERMALSAAVLNELIAHLRSEGIIEIRTGREPGVMRYALTDRGRTLAVEALRKSGYLGPSPVPLDEYWRVVSEQTVTQRPVTRQRMSATFSDTVLHEGVLDQLGPAVQSRRPIFIYGPAGAGKTFISQRLGRLFQDPVLIPHAIAIGEFVVQLFDPVYHHPINGMTQASSLLAHGQHDARYVLCRRPVVMSGGELALDMLELQHDKETKQYQAPLQLKANNGMYLIDDLGRQRVEPEVLLNRWTVPMEERRDFLALGSGQHFPVPFEVMLVFSTNLSPLELADEAFLRRIGYKIRFDYLTPGEYKEIWGQVCQAKDIAFDSDLVERVLEELHRANDAPLLPCHPRDLIELALGRARFDGRGAELTYSDLAAAWKSYFVRLA